MEPRVAPRGRTLGYGASIALSSPSPEVAVETDVVPGMRLGEYVVRGPLAEGGMSTVYAAVHPVIGKRAAIKVMTASLSRDPAAVEQFFLEARAVNQIRHPNIVDVFSCGRLPDGRSYLVMEWLAGETLAARLRQGNLSFSESCDILVQICDALDATHDKRIVHLDLKPENVYLVPVHGGRTLVKLLDFGIAKLLKSQSTSGLVPLGVFSGTPEYASPEQAQGLPTVDEKSDAYSFGVMAYEMFVGRLPFETKDVAELLRAHVQSLPPEPVLLSAEAPAALVELLTMLLDKAPERRPTLAMARARLMVMRDATLHVLTRTAPSISAPTWRSRRGIAASLGMLLMCVAVGGWAFVSHLTRKPLRTAAAEVHVAQPPARVLAEVTPTVVAQPAPIAVSHMRHARHEKKVVEASSPRRQVVGDALIDYEGNLR